MDETIQALGFLGGMFVGGVVVGLVILLVLMWLDKF